LTGIERRRENRERTKNVALHLPHCTFILSEIGLYLGPCRK